LTVFLVKSKPSTEAKQKQQALQFLLAITCFVLCLPAASGNIFIFRAD